MFEQPGFGDARPFRVKVGGQWYRHETEARWASFFERLGVGPQYEMSGAKLTDGSAYRPDFYLSRLDIWAEIKSSRPPVEDCRRYAQFARDSGRMVLICVGAPSLNRNIHIVLPTPANHWRGPFALASWLPLHGLALAADVDEVVVLIGGGFTQERLMSKPRQSQHIRALVEDARNLPLMPKDRLRAVG